MRLKAAALQLVVLVSFVIATSAFGLVSHGPVSAGKHVEVSKAQLRETQRNNRISGHVRRGRGGAVSITGRLSVVHGDDFKHGRSLTQQYSVRVSMTKSYPLSVPPTTTVRFKSNRRRGHKRDLVAGQTVVVRGKWSRKSTRASSVTVIAPPKKAATKAVDRKALRASTANGATVRRVAVILFDFPDAQGPIFTNQQLADQMFNQDDSVSNFFYDSSSGDMSFAGDVFGTYRIPHDFACNTDLSQLRDWANTEAVNHGVTLSSYDNFVYVFPAPCGHDMAGGWGEMPGTSTWIPWHTGQPLNYFKQVESHEIGHNFGLDHASSKICTVNGITVAQSTPANCVLGAYEDYADAMGKYRRSLFTGYHRLRLGFLPQANVLDVNPAVDNTYTVYPDEQRMASGTKQVIRIARPNAASVGEPRDYYYLDYRQPYLPIDNFPSTDSLVHGVQIRDAVRDNVPAGGGADVRPEALHVSTPGNGYPPVRLLQRASTTEDALAAGATFYDPIDNFSITTTSATTTSAAVHVYPGAPQGSMTDVYSSGGTLYVNAGAGKANNIIIARNGANLTVTDFSATLNRGSGCVAVSPANPTIASCVAAGISSIQVNGGDGDDLMSNVSELPMTGFGGTGDDDFEGGSGDDVFDGGAGNDAMRGLGGIDTLTYATRTQPISINNVDQGRMRGGEGTESDFAETDVESVIGGSGDDSLDTSGGGFTGSALDDDRIYGGPGNDVLSAGVGTDLLDGGPGNDTLNSVDTMSDQDLCGDGTGDVAHADSLDSIPNCETFTIVPVSVVSVVNGVFTLTAANGEAHQFTVSSNNGSLSISDHGSYAPAAGPGCLPNGSAAICPNASAITSGVVNLGDLDDSFVISSAISMPLTLNGGGGNDNLVGASGIDTYNGGEGNDTLNTSPGADVFDGGNGIDRATYEGRGDSITANVDGANTSGGVNEHDTISTNIEIVTGGSGDDTMNGNANDNQFDGGPGNDVINGGAGVDQITGGTGSNLIDGGPGADIFPAGGGGDTLTFESRSTPITASLADASLGIPGTDTDGDAIGSTVGGIRGGTGDDNLSIPQGTAGTLEGIGGNDTLTSHDGSDRLDGGSGNDTILGGDEPDGEGGGDSISGGSGIDTITAGTGDDVIDGGANADSINGGSGIDTLNYTDRSQQVTVNFNSAGDDGELNEGDNVGNSVDVLNLGSGGDVVTATSKGSGVTVDGGDGDDVVTGGNGIDYLYGDTGVDTLRGGNAGDYIYGEDGDDVLDPGTGNDYVSGGAGVNTVTYSTRTNPLHLTLGAGNNGEGAENDYIGNDVQNVVGGSGADQIAGSNQANDIQGGDGGDTLDGGAGNDILRGGNGVDTVSYATRTTRIEAANDSQPGDGETSISENDNIMSDVENLTGGSDGDFLRGNSADNVINGGDGQDTLMGAAGADTFIGGNDEDYVSYADHTASINVTLDSSGTDGASGENDYVTSTIENVQGSNGTSTIVGDGNANKLSSGGGPVVLSGGGGNDTLDGFTTDDTFDGGSGLDVINASDGNDTVTSRDGQIDTVQCGLGQDSVNRDPSDQLFDCEGGVGVPETTITSGPANGAFVNTSTVAYGFTSDYSLATFECSFDGAAFSACASPYTTPTLTATTHTFQVRARDAFGAVDVTPGTRTVTFDATGPSLNVTAPAAGAFINSTTPTLVFTASDPAGLQPTKCAVDGGSPFTCVSNTNLPALAQGNRSLVVTATDTAGNATSVPRNFVVDTTAPVVTISAPATSSSTTSATPTLTYSVTETNSHTELCKVDSGVFAACSSTLGPLSAGSHTVTVQSTDAATNIGTASSTFTVLNPELRQVANLAVPTTTENLTTQGTVDWSHYGNTTTDLWDHKSSGGSVISNIAGYPSGGTTLTRLTTGVAPTVSWSDGTPAASSSGTATGMTNTTSGVGKGVSLTVANAANAEALTLRLHVGVLNTQGKLELYWSSNPTNIVSDTSLSTTSTTNPANAIYQVTLRPPQATDTLNVRWTQVTSPSTTTSKVRIYSASLTKVGATRATAPAAADLTTDGVPPGVSLDWAHWGGTTSLPASPLVPIGKNGASQITSAILENGGSAAQSTATTNPVTTGFSWSNGDTTPSASNIKTGIYNTGTTSVGRGFSFTVPAASANAETLKLYVGVTNTSTTAAQPAKLELFWGSSTIPVYVDIVPSLTNATANYVYAINLRHPTAATTLKVKWSTNTTSTSHRVTLQSAVLLQG